MKKNWTVTLFLATLGGQIEVGTVAPDTPPPANQPTAEHYEEELTLPTLPPAPVTLNFKGPGLFGPETGLGGSKHQLGVFLLAQKFSVFNNCMNFCS